MKTLSQKKKTTAAASGKCIVKLTEIHFEDKGQDFLIFRARENGQITDVQPFQFSVWSKYTIGNISELKRGGDVILVRDKHDPLTIKYPIESLKQIEVSITAKQKKAQHWYNWGNEPKEHVSTGYYDKNEVWKSTGFMHLEAATKLGLTFCNPNS